MGWGDHQDRHCLDCHAVNSAPLSLPEYRSRMTCIVCDALRGTACMQANLPPALIASAKKERSGPTWIAPADSGLASPLPHVTSAQRHGQGASVVGPHRLDNGIAQILHSPLACCHHTTSMCRKNLWLLLHPQCWNNGRILLSPNRPACNVIMPPQCSPHLTSCSHSKHEHCQCHFCIDIDKFPPSLYRPVNSVSSVNSVNSVNLSTLSTLSALSILPFMTTLSTLSSL